MFKTFPACTVAETEPDWKESFFDAALIGRPDLILYNPNDENYIIVDFKTGKAPPKKDCIDSGEDGRGIKNFQLPAYKRLAEKKAYTPVNQGVFAAINEVKISAPFDVKGESTALFEAAAEDFDRQFRRFSSEISRIYFEESCTVIYADCLSCDYQAVCRSCFTIQRDKRMGRRRHG